MGVSDTWRPLAEALLGKAELSPNDVAQQSGISRDRAGRLWRALGFPPVADDERVFTRADVEVLRAVQHLIDEREADPADLLQLTRVVGQSLARVADAEVTAVVDRVARVHADEPAAPAATAELFERVRTLAPALEQLLGYVWRRHLLAALLRISATPAAADRDQTVGFADLVGFTAISQALDSKALAAMVDRFEAVVYEHIPARGGRVVKMIGDEVMFAADDAETAAQIALELVDAHARDDILPNVRVGLASGPTLAWEGDLFGPTVNLASRLVNLARSQTVLVSEALGQLLLDNAAFALRRLRGVRLQGIGRVSPWVLRRAR
jgi:adenylate cyclase